MPKRKTPPRSRKAPTPARPSEKPVPRKGKSNRLRIPVVGLGCSAGGFDALQAFLGAVGEKPDMAFIVVSHLDPNRASELPALLSRHTTLPVSSITDGAAVEINQVYVIPPDRYVEVDRDRFRLVAPSDPRGHRLAVDHLFYSMANAFEECAIGVVLSGNGSDGSLGLRSIKASGGLALAQEPATAEYDGMPRNAISTGLVDHIQPPGLMMDAIRRYVRHDYVQNGTRTADGKGEEIHRILGLLHSRRNVDFSGYKKGTLVRRITRRMGLRQIDKMTDYVKALRDDPDEINALFNDLLIQVTRFFREPEAWAALERDVLEKLVDEADTGSPIRVWVPGCATGEEAYTLAILLSEIRDRKQKHVPIQIFASDLDPKALEYARAGSYPESIAADVSPERLRCYFTRAEHRFNVQQSVRDLLVFAIHNVLADPPFSRLDLISCRNMLIYLEAPMQRRVLDLFHFALRPGRYLFLGTSETIGPQTDIFQPLTTRSRVYRRLGSVRLDRIRLPVPDAGPVLRLPGVHVPPSRDQTAMALAREVVLERFTSACVLINRKQEILALFGPTARYLTQPVGPLSTEILSWVRESTRLKLRVAIQTAMRKGKAVTVHGLRIKRGNDLHAVTCTVEPISEPAEADGLLLVVFQDEGVHPVKPAPALSVSRRGQEKVVRQLESELQSVREELQSNVEQLESSNEELRATNEEVLSMNEELQSANEELETSKEELQSVNEELTTVNSQLEAKITELQELNNDISNLLTSTELPLLFLDRQLLIRRYTPPMKRLFRLIPTDIGRPISDITTGLEDPHLLEDARHVLERLTPITRDVASEAGDVYSRRVLPYRTQDDRIQGVVVTYSDVSHLRAVDLAAQHSAELAQVVLETVPTPILVLDQTLVVRSANAAFLEAFRLPLDQVHGARLHDLGDGEWNIPDLRRAIQDIVAGKSGGTTVRVRRQFQSVGERVLLVTARGLTYRDRLEIVLMLDDITRRATNEETRAQLLRDMVVREDRERQRLALELHDEAGQHITAFLLGLAALKASYQDPASATVVERLQKLADELAQSLHGLSLELRPVALDQHGLNRALQNYLEDVVQRHHLKVDFQTRGADGVRVPTHIETVLYRVTQEAMTNVLKHAGAGGVSVVLDRGRGVVRLVIEDDGRGFDLETATSDGSHLGLRGMRERLELVNGSLTIETGPGKGTAIYASVPLDEPGGRT